MTPEPHWKVRVAVGGVLLHLASRTEPELERDAEGRIVGLRADLVSGAPYADTVGFVDWSQVRAVTWRRSA